MQTTPLTALFFLSISALVAASAENIVFPADAGVVNVKTQYGAKGDGVTDDTAALQRSVDENKGKNRTLYFPNGTYLLSGGAHVPFGERWHVRPETGEPEVG
jgi:polygalacturonase